MAEGEANKVNDVHDIQDELPVRAADNVDQKLNGEPDVANSWKTTENNLTTE